MSGTENKLGHANPHLSEVILKTKRFKELRDWYHLFVGRDPFVDRPRPEKASWTGAMSVSFFQLVDDYPYMQILGIFEVDDTSLSPGVDPGLHHAQLMHSSFDDMFAHYERLKEAGITPAETWNHGPVTSFYYRDPDGNLMEVTVANFPTKDEFFGYFETESYLKNISGIRIDADDYIGKYRAGTPREELIVIPV